MVEAAPHPGESSILEREPLHINTNLFIAISR
jgi:hypothetical protein